MKTHDKQSKATESIQPKAKNQSSVSTILSGYKNSLQRQAIEEEEPVQGKFDGIIQRHAYWPVDDNGKATTNVPTAVAPGGRFIRRDGASINHRLYNKSNEAKNAARKATAWGDNGLSTRNPASPDAGAGYYQYNKSFPQDYAGAYTVAGGTAMVVRHDSDPNAILTPSGGAAAIPGVVHWHAATSAPNADIKVPHSDAAQPNYNTIDIEHFYVNPLL